MLVFHCIVLGFSGNLFTPGLIKSDLPVQIEKVVTVRLECNIATGACQNSDLVHTIHEFGLSVDSGYAVNETPKNIIYYPVNSRTINNITIKILDQDGDLISFRGEVIVVRLELREWV